MPNTIETLQYGWGVSVEHDDTYLTSRVIDNGFVAKTFTGETAWSDAERLAYDITVSRQYA